MFVKIKENSSYNKNVSQYVCDTESELNSIQNATIGSIAFSIEEATFWIINSEKEWVQLATSSGGSGGGGDSAHKAIIKALNDKFGFDFLVDEYSPREVVLAIKNLQGPEENQEIIDNTLSELYNKFVEGGTE